MARTATREMIVAIGGGFLAGAALIGLLFMVSSGEDMGADAIKQIGWVVPLAAGLVTGGMALVLLGTVDDVTDEADSLLPSTCAACGSPIIAEWRLCPHCGSLLECDTTMPGISPSPERSSQGV